MSRLKLLDATEARQFDLPPILTRQQQDHYFTLLTDLADGLPQFRKPVTRIGFHLQWGYFRLTQKFYRVTAYHPADIDFIIARLSIEHPIDLNEYTPQTAWEHQQLIMNVLNVTPF